MMLPKNSHPLSNAVCWLTLSAAAASGQLLGFGTSCPTLDVDVTNIGYWPIAALMTVVHSPDIELIDDTAPVSDSEALLTTWDCIPGPDGLDALTDFLGLVGDEESPAYDSVCGQPREGDAVDFFRGLALVTGDLFPGESYDTFTINPDNQNSCSCSDMRISMLAPQYNECIADLYLAAAQSSFTWLNGHELQSVTAASHTHAHHYGLAWWTGPPDTLDSYVKEVAATSDVSDPYTHHSTDSLLIVFTPQTGSSTSILSLWALLMGGWF